MAAKCVPVTSYRKLFSSSVANGILTLVLELCAGPELELVLKARGALLEGDARRSRTLRRRSGLAALGARRRRLSLVAASLFSSIW